MKKVDEVRVNDPDIKHTDLEYLARYRLGNILTISQLEYIEKLEDAIHESEEGRHEDG